MLRREAHVDLETWLAGNVRHRSHEERHLWPNNGDRHSKLNHHVLDSCISKEVGDDEVRASSKSRHKSFEMKIGNRPV
jgi:hypothetical protein